MWGHKHNAEGFLFSVDQNKGSVFAIISVSAAIDASVKGKHLETDII